jgi:hypothetical protein
VAASGCGHRTLTAAARSRNRAKSGFLEMRIGGCSMKNSYVLRVDQVCVDNVRDGDTDTDCL